MYKILLIISFVLSSNLFNVSFSQGSITYDMKVLDTKGKTVSNLTITAVEKRTFDRKVFKTGVDGKLMLKLDTGGEWSLNIGDMKGYRTLKVPEHGDRKGKMTVTYNVKHWNRINQPPVDRSKLTLRIVNQTIEVTEKGDKEQAVISISLKDKQGKPWKGVEVQMTNFELLTSFTAITDKRGIARFKVPNNKSYQIDIDGDDNASYCDLSANSTSRKLFLLFEKIDFVESLNQENCIVQKFKEEPKGTSNRVFVTLQVIGGPNNGAHEDVYLDMTYSNKRFYAKTNKEGKAVFLLPMKRQYLVSFPFQKNMDLLDLSDFRGVGSCGKAFFYEPDPRLQFPERYLPDHDNIQELEITDYLTSSFGNTEDGELINVHAKWGNKKINSGSKESILELGFSVKKTGNKERASKPVNISFVLDRSGSMGGENMAMLKESMLTFIDKLGPNDKCSIVFFDDEMVVAFKQGTAKDKTVLKDIIAAVEAGGGTNIYEGLKAGYEQVDSCYSDKYTNRVILLTDGYGSRPIDFILEESKKYFKKGIAVSTIGIGNSYNAPLLNLLSEYSGGLKHHIVESGGINNAMEAEFESLFYPVAENLTVTVAYNNAIIYKRLYGVPEMSNDNSKVTFQLENVYATLNKLALVKFKLDQPTLSIEKDKIVIEVKYHDLLKNKDVVIRKEKSLEWSEETDLELLTTQESRNIYSVAYINQALKAIADLCVEKNYEQAKANLSETYAHIMTLNDNKIAADLKPILEGLQLYLAALDRVLQD